MAHDLKLLWRCCNNKGTGIFKLRAELCTLLTLPLFLCFFNKALTCKCEMFAQSDILLLSLELVNLLLQTLNEIFGNGVL
jgi:hypothetical protein